MGLNNKYYRGHDGMENLTQSQNKTLLRFTKWPAVEGILIYRGISSSKSP